MTSVPEFPASLLHVWPVLQKLLVPALEIGGSRSKVQGASPGAQVLTKADLNLGLARYNEEILGINGYMTYVNMYIYVYIYMYIYIL